MHESPDDQRALSHNNGGKPMFRSGVVMSAVAVGLGLATPSFAQSTATTVYMPAILELSGSGAVSGVTERRIGWLGSAAWSEKRYRS